MIAVAGGFGAALAFAGSTLCASNASRKIGPAPVLAWVAIVGLAASGGAAVVQRPVPAPGQLGWLAIIGFGNVAGLLLVYMAVRSGKVGVVAPIVSTEGAVTAVIAVLAGEPLSWAEAALAAVVAGVVLVAWPPAGQDAGAKGVGAGSALAICASLVFGTSLYATGHVASLPLAWVIVPARIVGVTCVALPLAVTGRLRLTRSAAMPVAVAGICEVAGFAFYALGARHEIAVIAVIASMFAALAAAGAYVFFAERLSRLARFGVVTIAIGVGSLAAIHP